MYEKRIDKEITRYETYEKRIDKKIKDQKCTRREYIRK